MLPSRLLPEACRGCYRRHRGRSVEGIRDGEGRGGEVVEGAEVGVDIGFDG